LLTLDCLILDCTIQGTKCRTQRLLTAVNVHSSFTNASTDRRHTLTAVTTTTANANAQGTKCRTQRLLTAVSAAAPAAAAAAAHEGVCHLGACVSHNLSCAQRGIHYAKGPFFSRNRLLDTIGGGAALATATTTAAAAAAAAASANAPSTTSTAGASASSPPQSCATDCAALACTSVTLGRCVKLNDEGVAWRPDDGVACRIAPIATTNNNNGAGAGAAANTGAGGATVAAGTGTATTAATSVQDLVDRINAGAGAGSIVLPTAAAATVTGVCEVRTRIVFCSYFVVAHNLLVDF
jgi:hypothetical protein